MPSFASYLFDLGRLEMLFVMPEGEGICHFVVLQDGWRRVGMQVYHKDESETPRLELQREMEGGEETFICSVEDTYLRQAFRLEIACDSQGGCVNGKY